MSGAVFSANTSSHKVLIFGDSKILAGFVPAYFDGLAAADGAKVYSYNSGYPGRVFFVPQLKEMVKNGSSTPDILLLTQPWKPGRDSFDIFHPIQDDHDVAERIFPFRYLLRDALSFLMTSRQHGGPLRFYRESRRNVAKMLQDRGYYFIAEQSQYPNDQLPDDFHLATDHPDIYVPRNTDSDSTELDELNAIIAQHHIQCYYVPTYMRSGEFAPAPGVDQAFADLLRQHTSCKLLGPDYYTYPNRMFSDLGHLNREGAKVYTEAIYKLLAKEQPLAAEEGKAH